MFLIFLRYPFIVLLGLFISPLGVLAMPVEDRYAALVVDADSGKVLFAENTHQLKYPASLTKMMTLYMVFDALERGTLSLDQRLRVSERAAAQPPSKLGLQAGGTLTVRQAILALVTRSANDVAVVVAEALGKTEFNFARQMTKQAHALGMGQTTFRNASGLPDPHQVTTAWDILKLARALQRDFPQHYHYFSVTDFSFNGTTHRNHNRLLGSYDGINGIKTGYIRASGFNLVASVQRNGRHIIGIVFGGDSAAARDTHMRDLLDQGFVQLEAAVPGRISTLTADSLVSINRPAPVNEQGSTDSQPSGIIANTSYWAVQVGVYSRLASAEKQASNALQAVPSTLRQAQLSIDPVMRDDKTFYHARFKGLSRMQAETACQALQQQRIDCFTFPSAG